MFLQQRLDQIEELILVEGKVLVKDLSEKFNISDVDSLIEIENYVYREFSDEFEKASGYTIK